MRSVPARVHSAPCSAVQSEILRRKQPCSAEPHSAANSPLLTSRVSAGTWRKLQRSWRDCSEKEKVDPEPMLTVATRVMELEVQVKRAHMRLLIELKNQLDSDQQRTLRRLRE